MIFDDYYQALREIHEILQPRTYLEIGIRNGDAFRFSSRKTLSVGIDPNIKLNYAINPDSKMFNMTSDEFFCKYDLNEILNNCPVDLAFIDGMHNFEFALRDFMNVEKYSRKRSFIILHDTIPKDEITASRVRQTTFWTGDVWKMILCLKEYRRDLQIYNINIPPSGLCVITHLNPKSKALLDNYEIISKKYMNMDYKNIMEMKDFKQNIIEQKNVNFKVLFNHYNKYPILSSLMNLFFQ
jgi:hypothetical protein